MSEKTTIVVTPRDRFSTTEKCLANIIKHTPEPYELYAVLAGCPPAIQKKLTELFGKKVKFIFGENFLNTAQARNLALRSVGTRLVTFLDTDVFVRPGWYEPLLACQAETQAAMVGPIILDRQNLIHAAGNNLYITKTPERSYASMEIRYAHQMVAQETNIQRQENDFLEIHCQLVVTGIARTMGIYDENLREYHEMDSGLTLTRAGHKILLEPRSFVYLYYPERLTDADDIAIFCWKWDMDTMRAGFDIFYKKWGLDLNYRNAYEKYFEHVNRRCNFFSRLFPSPLSIQLDQWKHNLYKMTVGRLT